jgi:hypothetical protein
MSSVLVLLKLMIIVEPKQAHYQIEAESIDRTGFSVGTLHDENTYL